MTLLSSRNAPVPPAAQAPHERAREAYGRIPLSFESNRGQTDASVDFLARGAGYALFLKPTEAVLLLRNADSGSGNEEAAGRSLTTTSSPKTEAVRSKVGPQPKVLRMRLVGADASAQALGLGELAGKTNYLLGDDPSQWRTDVPTYARVRYAEVYPGVDVVYYGNQRQLEYDFRIAPGGDPRAVSLRFEGADKIDVDANGDLLLKLGGSVVRQPKPVVYQEVAGARREVEAAYAVAADGRVGFSLGEYDKVLPLVIDPTLVYSTYLGGSGGEEGFDIAVDSEGNAYVTGETSSADFPTANAIHQARKGITDAFVTKINAAGSALVYSTYLGGGDDEEGRAIALDSAGNAYVTGETTSTNFPTTVNAFQNVNNSESGGGMFDVFVTKLNAAGSALIYSTYLGGISTDRGNGVAVDSAGNAYVVGQTSSTNFPTANAFQNVHGFPCCGGTPPDAFVTKLNAAGSALVYSTYLGGSNTESGNSIALDSEGSAYVVGETSSTNFPTANALQATNVGGMGDAFVTKFNPAGSALVYSTYLGGSNVEKSFDIAVDSAGNAYVVGDTASDDFPTANAIYPARNGSIDAFVTKLNAAGTALVYSTYLGSSDMDSGDGVAVDSAGNAYVVGTTSSVNNFPTANALQCTGFGLFEVFVTKFNAAGSALLYSTSLAGSRSDIARGVAVDSAGNAYVVGLTFSADFPTVGAVQSAFAGNQRNFAGDSFVAKVGDTSALPASQLQFTQTAPVVQEDVTSVTLTVRRTGDTSQAVTVDYATVTRIVVERFDIVPAPDAALERFDYTPTLGTLRFAAGEVDKTIKVLVNEDSFTEGDETFNLSLSNSTGGATLPCAAATAVVRIADDAAEPSTNAIDDATAFTGTHYHDFLNRQADPTGLDFWANQIAGCGADEGCIDRRRTSVSTAFFLSIESLQTGFYVFRLYRATFPDSAARPRGMPRYREFVRDTQEIGRGVVVKEGNWEQLLQANKQEFARRWVQRPDFIAQFPESMTFDEYVAKLAANSGVTLTPEEINIAFESYSNTVEGRANTLRAVVESGSVYNRQFNAGFVLSQYMGYLRRDPNDAPDTDYAGFDFWLAKLDGFSQPGEDVQNEQTALARVNRAEMVRAFIRSLEYRGRFGQ
jgi:hypothetical protein